MWCTIILWAQAPFHKRSKYNIRSSCARLICVIYHLHTHERGTLRQFLHKAQGENCMSGFPKRGMPMRLSRRRHSEETNLSALAKRSALFEASPLSLICRVFSIRANYYFFKARSSIYSFSLIYKMALKISDASFTGCQEQLLSNLRKQSFLNTT